MKKIIYNMLAVVAGIILSSSCSKEVLPAGNALSGNLTLGATIQNELTKTAVDATDNKKITWASEDSISVWGESNNKFVLGSGAGTAKGCFSGTVSAGTAQYAMYPYNAAATISGGVITTTVPNTQTAPKGSFDPKAAILVGSISDGNISFLHALAYLKITAPSDVNDLIEITIESNGGIQITGDAKFTASTGEFAANAAGTPCSLVTVKPAGGVFVAGGIYYAAIIPGTYTDGLTVKYIYKDDANHKLIGKKKSSATGLTLTAGSAKLLAAADLTSCTTYDVAFQLRDGGPYWALTNIGANTRTEYGQHFAWGYSKGYTHNGSTWTDGSKDYSFDYYIINRSPSSYQDAASANWGAGWVVPSIDDIKGLIYNNNNKVEFIASANYSRWNEVGVVGVFVTGKGDYASNSIFLPAGGDGIDKTLRRPGSYGYYWSGSEQASGYAYGMVFSSDYGVVSYYGHKYEGNTVRPCRYL